MRNHKNRKYGRHLAQSIRIVVTPADKYINAMLATMDRLRTLGKDALVAEAKAAGVRGYSRMTKDQLVAAIADASV